MDKTPGEINYIQFTGQNDYLKFFGARTMEKYHTIRAVVEAKVPQNITEKNIVNAVKASMGMRLQFINHQNFRTEVKHFSHVLGHEKKSWTHPSWTRLEEILFAHLIILSIIAGILLYGAVK